jgi:sec-independent protein translocase protein TatA
MGNIGPWQLLIVAVIILLLFGAKRLPEMARGLGRSLKIFKAETKGLIDDEKKDDSVVPESSTSSESTDTDDADTTRAVEPTKVETTGERANESSSRDA